MSSRKSVSPTPSKTSKPRTRSDGSAKAEKDGKGKTPAAAKRAKRKPSTKAATTKQGAAAALPASTGSTKDNNDTELTPKQQMFVREYLIDLNATQAAIRAGYSEKTAKQIGTENLSKPVLQAAIAAAQDERARRTNISADRALREVWSIAMADPRELVQVKVGCCRHCWGENFRFQRTVGEMNRDMEAHAVAGKDASTFDEKGGIGFNPLRPPNKDCPDCSGDGLARVALADTRNISPQAAALYAGAKQGKYGIEIQMHSKDAALEKAFRHLGLYEKDNDQKSKGFGQALADFASGLHARSIGRLPIVPPKRKDEQS